MSQLANEHDAINLSQGFPDYPCSSKLIRLVTNYIEKGFNQYAPMPGLMKLRETVAEKTNRLYGSNYHPETEITITAGGTQAIFTAIAAVIHPNDEVIIFEPAYDCYAPTVKLFGGVVKSFELSPPDYKINWDMVRKLISSRTRLIILNSPQNPTGTILSEEDIRQLHAITKNTDILILSDEVYEHLIYDGVKHLSIARYPELKERSFIIASFGKLLHTTGWKVGYCMASAQLMKEFRKIHQFNVFSVNTPMQYAIADYLQDKETYENLGTFFQKKRDYFAKLLQQTRFELLPCQGSYFQSVYYSNISDEIEIDFAKRLTVQNGVASIPNSAFYSKATNYGILRFCFAKKDETLELAVQRLSKI